MTHLTITKLVIETASPMAISTGMREIGFDTQLVRDVNGLPMIPATAIAGVWSHLTAKHHSEAMKFTWFGHANSQSSKASALTISSAYMLDSQCKPVAPFATQRRLELDPLLNLCQQLHPLHRERVAINDRGVAKETGKFDQVLLPKGIRFALTLEWSDQRDYQLSDEDWHTLLALWELPTFAFGSSTRNGLGQVKIVHSAQRTFDLVDGPKAAKALAQFRSSNIKAEHQLKSKLQSLVESHETLTLKLKAIDNWRCGSGTALVNERPHAEHSVNMITYSEKGVSWNADNTATIDQKATPILCGSSIKGILAHRIAFHYRRHQKQWAETMMDVTHEQWQQRPQALSPLLGYTDPHDSGLAQAGALWVQDAEIKFTHTQLRHHNSIDRFTGGVRRGALFTEELLYQPRFTLKLHLTKPLDELEPALRSAFLETIQDLELGLLPLGAGSGRGTSMVCKDDGVSA